MAKCPNPTSANPAPSVPKGRTGVAAPASPPLAMHPHPPPSSLPHQRHPAAPCSHLARRDMVLSLGHIHRSELPPTTASVIAGCRGDTGTEFGLTGAAPMRDDSIHLGSQSPWSQIAATPMKVTWCFQPGCWGKKNTKPSKTHKISLGRALVLALRGMRAGRGTGMSLPSLS